MPAKIILTDKQSKYLLKNRARMTSARLSFNFNLQFGTDFSALKIERICRRDLGLIVGKGFTPKGNRRITRTEKELFKGTNSSIFKKGYVPTTTLPIGSERVNKSGYVHIKTADGWKLKQRVVWEQERGAIPEGYVIYFKDGNRSNCDVSNLECIKKGALTIANRWFQFESYPGDMRETVKLLAQIKHESMRVDRA